MSTPIIDSILDIEENILSKMENDKNTRLKYSNRLVPKLSLPYNINDYFKYNNLYYIRSIYFEIDNPNYEIQGMEPHIYKDYQQYLLGNEDIVSPKIIIIECSFPLNGKYYFKLISDNDDGMTRLEVMKGIGKIYNKIYKDETAAEEEDSIYEELPYEIWRFELEDLVINSIYFLYMYDNGIPIYKPSISY